MDNYAQYLERENTLDRIREIIQSLPSLDLISSKLGQEEAESYLSCCEAIESSHGDIVTDVDSSRSFTANECREALGVLQIVAANVGDENSILDAYETQLERRRRDQQHYRNQIAIANAPKQQKAQSLGIWFPVRSERERTLWSQVAGGIELYTMSDEVRKILKHLPRNDTDYGIVQYVPRRTMSPSSIVALESNLAAMRAFLIRRSS